MRPAPGVADRSAQVAHGESAMASPPTSGPSRVVEATVSGIETCQAWKQATGTDATFGRAVTGPFGALGWLSGFESMGEFDAAWTASSADENWITTMNGAQENFGQDFGSGTSTLYRKM